MYLPNCFRDEEGRDLLGKRTMDFKVTYLDAGLTSSYISDSESSSVHGGSNGSTAAPAVATPTSVTPSSTKIGKRYKTHLRDFLSSCRSNNKRKNSSAAAAAAAAAANDLYHDSTSAAPAAYASVYSQSGAAAAVASHPYDSTNPLYMQQNIAAAAAASAAPYQSIYSPVDNHRYFPPEYLASYRSLTATYYPEYAASAHAAQYIGNTYFDPSRPTAALSSIQYDAASQLKYFEDKSNPECKYSSYDTGKCSFMYRLG